MPYTTPLPDSKINQATRSKLGEAIYLLAHIIRKADWKTGKLRTTHERIARETGFPEPTIKKWIQRLVDVGEIICARTIHGSVITISDYDAIAYTRGVRKRCCMRPIGTTRGPNEGPQTNPIGTRSGPNNVIRILSQNKEKNSFLSSPSGHEKLSGGANDSPRCPVRQTEADHERQERIARQFMASADECARNKLIDSALESMENDPRPFVRIFVRRDEQGRREFVSHSGDGPLMARIGLLIEGQEDEKQV
jgi:adenine-specific DNA glycosylase